MSTASTSIVTFRELEQAALEAHRNGTRWATFWPAVADIAIEMADGDQEKFQRLADRLLCVLVSGETSGLEPPGDLTVDIDSPRPGAVGSSWRPRPSVTAWRSVRDIKCPS